MEAYCWRMQFSCRRFSTSEKQHCYPSKTTMNGTTMQNRTEQLLYEISQMHNNKTTLFIEQKLKI